MLGSTALLLIYLCSNFIYNNSKKELKLASVQRTANKMCTIIECLKVSETPGVHPFPLSILEA